MATGRNLLAAAALCLALPTHCRAETLKPEELVAKHLESIGPAQARAAVKTRVAQGKAQFKVLVGGAGQMEGKAGLVSEDRKLRLLLKFASGTYHGEQFVSDGDKVEVAFSGAEKNRSAFGDFVFGQNAMFREGLLGGVLSTAWPLLNLDAHKAKLDYEGLKKIDGRELHDIHYRPKKGTDLDIHLYFEPETFRHVLTVYKLSVRPLIESGQNNPNETVRIGGPADQEPTIGEIQTAKQQETRYRIEEKFSDFKTIDGLTMPAHYDIHFTQELRNGDTSVSDWDIVFDQIMNNVPLDPKNFQVK